MIRVGFHSNDPARQTSVVGSRVRDARRRRSSPLPPAAPVPRASSRAMPRVDPSVVRRRVLDRLRESDVEVDESDLPDVRPPSRASHRAIGARLARASSSSDGRPLGSGRARGLRAPSRLQHRPRRVALPVGARRRRAGPARAASRTFATPTVARASSFTTTRSPTTTTTRARATTRVAAERSTAPRGGRRGERNASVYNRLLRESRGPRAYTRRAIVATAPRRRPTPPRAPAPARPALLRGERTPEPAPQGGHTTTEDEGGGYWATTEPDDGGTTDADAGRRDPSSAGDCAGVAGRDSAARRAWIEAGSLDSDRARATPGPVPGDPNAEGSSSTPRGDERGGLFDAGASASSSAGSGSSDAASTSPSGVETPPAEARVGHVLPGVLPGDAARSRSRARAGRGRRRRRRCPGRGGILGGRVGRVGRVVSPGAPAEARGARAGAVPRRVRVPVGRGRGRARGRHGRGRGRRRAFARGFRRVATARGGFGRGLGFDGARLDVASALRADNLELRAKVREAAEALKSAARDKVTSDRANARLEARVRRLEEEARALSREGRRRGRARAGGGGAGAGGEGVAAGRAGPARREAAAKNAAEEASRRATPRRCARARRRAPRARRTGARSGASARRTRRGRRRRATGCAPTRRSRGRTRRRRT